MCLAGWWLTVKNTSWARCSRWPGSKPTPSRYRRQCYKTFFRRHWTLDQNNLECFSLTSYYQPDLIFASPAWECLIGYQVVPYSTGWLIVLTTKIRQTCKNSAVTNTLAYFTAASITKKNAYTYFNPLSLMLLWNCLSLRRFLWLV